MLNRNDLSKQFELVVQQEITNYNNSLTNVYFLINELKDQIADVKQLYLHSHAAICSRSKLLESNQKTLSENINRISQKLDSSINDQNVLNKAHSEEFFEMSEIMKNKVNVDSKFSSKLEMIVSEIAKIKSDCEKIRVSSEQAFEEIRRLIRKEIFKMKDEIISMPTQAELFKRQLEEKIDSHILDVQGILKEILISKKETHILEKKIENLYTLFERLKKVEAST